MRIDSQAAADFVSLLTSHQDALRVFIISKIPGSPDVNDILQEVNITLWEKRESFEQGTNFTAWAYKVASYKVLNHIKKLRNSKELVFGDGLESLLTQEIPTPPPEMLSAKLTALTQCMKSIKPRHRELLEARYSGSPEDMRQFSSESKRSRGSLRITLSRLRASLRDCVSTRLATITTEESAS